MSLTRINIIEFLNSQHKQNHRAQGVTKNNIEETQKFVKKLYTDITQSKEEHDFINEMDTSTLTRYAYNLMIYRACLSDAALNASEYHNSYIQYINTDNIYSRSLENGNPFLLRRHAYKMYNLLLDLQNKDANPEELQELNNSIRIFHENLIANLDPHYYNALRQCLLGYAKALISLSLKLFVSESKEQTELTKNTLKDAKSCFALAKKSDASIKLYDDSNIKPALSLKDSDTVLKTIKRAKHTKRHSTTLNK